MGWLADYLKKTQSQGPARSPEEEAEIQRAWERFSQAKRQLQRAHLERQQRARREAGDGGEESTES